MTELLGGLGLRGRTWQVGDTELEADYFTTEPSPLPPGDSLYYDCSLIDIHLLNFSVSAYEKYILLAISLGTKRNKSCILV